ncbi:class I adenylate-forming enzyme family protein [Sporosarcina cyprini]|uniref:class I adenylate-forming enzyme family protein n=1 Tax=Sporosarcina cyprini TaxID=2910523 RepID=UPI001EDEB2A4|nr:AMP-binding protein [Sporosarcina cyprini]MCG3088252.1 AMP-binding protein [Sporosarcina cyprini]
MQHMLFGDPIRQNAIRYGEKEALSCQGKRFTYDQFNRRINRLSNALLEAGVTKGDKIAFMLVNCNELFEVMFACAKVGAVFVPINSRFVGPEIEYVLNNSEAVALIYGSEFDAEVGTIVDQAKDVKLFVSVGGRGEVASLEYETWIETCGDGEPVLSYSIEELDTVCIMYTGGTTGYPKGAVRSHRSMYLVALLFSIEFGIGRGGKGLVAGPLYGAAALSTSVPNLLVGNPVHILPKFHPVEVLKAIDTEKTTSGFLAPPMFDAIFSLPEEVLGQFDVSSMKTLISVGAPLHSSTKEKIMAYFQDVDLNEFYGATEHGGSTNLFPEYQADKDRSVGVPMLGMEVKLVDDEGNEVPAGQPGEFLVKGLTLCDEYFKNPEATAEAFHGEWLGLGDMGVQDEDGSYSIVDRKQDMILSGALNVYPAEIEGVLHRHPKIMDVAVIGVPDSKWGEAVKAIVVLKPGETADAQEIIDFCEGRLARYKKPRSVDFVDELPRSLQGKLLKYKLREMMAAEVK